MSRARRAAIFAASFITTLGLVVAGFAFAHTLYWDDCADGVCPEVNIWGGHEHVDIMDSDGANDAIWGGQDQDDMVAGGGGDFLDGELGWDHLNGQDGNDEVRGGDGNDDIDGGPGNNDVCYGGPGTDTFTQCEEKHQ